MYASNKPSPLRIQTFKDKLKAQHHHIDQGSNLLNGIMNLLGNNNNRGENNFSRISEVSVEDAPSVEKSQSDKASSIAESLVIQSDFKKASLRERKNQSYGNISIGFNLQPPQQDKNMKETARFNMTESSINGLKMRSDQKTNNFTPVKKIDSQIQPAIQNRNIKPLDTLEVNRKNSFEQSKHVSTQIGSNQSPRYSESIEIMDFDAKNRSGKYETVNLNKSKDISEKPSYLIKTPTQVLINTLPIDSNLKNNRSYRNIPLQRSSENSQSKHLHSEKAIKIVTKKNTQSGSFQIYSHVPKNYSSGTEIYIKTPDPETETKIKQNNESNAQAKQGDNLFLKLLTATLQPQPSETSQPHHTPHRRHHSRLKKSKQSDDEDDDDQNRPDYQKTTNGILKLVANLGSNKSDKEIERLRNKMKNQKNLKLKDYLRLASLSNDARFDKYSKSLSKNQARKKSNGNNLTVATNQSQVEEEKKTSLFDRSRNPIDPVKSISLIKASLNKKLESALAISLKFFDQIEQGAGLVGNQYQDLVFMCNFHRVYAQNMFKTVDLLQDLFKQYKDKRQIIDLVNKKDPLTEQQVLNMFSPRKRKKSASDMNLDLVQRILFGFNIIKQDETLNKPQHSQQSQV